jgi:hypothetical protein
VTDLGDVERHAFRAGVGFYLPLIDFHRRPPSREHDCRKPSAEIARKLFSGIAGW